MHEGIRVLPGILSASNKCEFGKNLTSMHLHSLICKTKIIKPTLPVLQGGSYALVCKEHFGAAVQNPISWFHPPTFWFGRSRLELRNHTAFFRNSPGASNAVGSRVTPSTDSDLSSACWGRPFLEEKIGF